MTKKNCGSGGGGSGRYGGGGGKGPSSRLRLELAYVRADVTFLRQDFSVQMPTPAPAAPPVRFDFVVRTRAMSLQEALDYRKESRKEARDPTAYPQREAVLFALREVTGEDAGQTTLAWQRQFPNYRIDVQAGKLVDALGKATGRAERDRLLAQYASSVGPVHTRALAWTVNRSGGQLREQARAALAGRVARMSPVELRGALRHDLPEVREAAVRACLHRKDRDFVPALIPLVQDSEPAVARQARSALEEMTGKSFPLAAQWKVWWHGPGVLVAAR
jgi:hypothetical protein